MKRTESSTYCDNMERISIVVPMFNAERYISKCVRSIQSQTFTRWNLIIVDDGSTDSGGGICDAFAKKDKRITVIHQENRGSVEARKAGVLSQAAQRNSWIMLSDADDTMPPDAIDKLYNAAQKYQAEMVVGAVTKMFKGISIPSRWKSPCFQIDKPQLYSHDEIIGKLFISYFGITNFPVSLCAKLYRTEQLTRAINFAPVVKFMGDDLSVSIRLMPEVKKLVIIPDVVYNYRIGGGTSKFMPFMMDDFAKLYTYKQAFIKRYPMPQDAQYYMDIELMNVTKSHFLQCLTNGGFNQDQLADEIEKVCAMPLVQEASRNLMGQGKRISAYAEQINRTATDEIIQNVYRDFNATKKERAIRNFLKRIM